MNLLGLARATKDLDVFVAPTADNIGRLRADGTVVPTATPQALYLMNNATISDYANRIAMRKDLPAELPDRVNWLYEILFARQPGEDEMVLTKKYLRENPDTAKWQKFVHALLLTNEFSFIE